MSNKNYLLYKICCKNPDIKECYVGSTCDYRARVNRHKYAATNEHDSAHKYKLYKFINANGGWDNWQVSVIEELKEQDVVFVKKREDELIKEYNATLNSTRAYRDPEYILKYYSKGSEWYEKNKKRANERYKQMREKLTALKHENDELKTKMSQIYDGLSTN